MKIVDWSKKVRGKSKVVCISGEDGDLYVGFEGQIPLRVRDLIELWYASVKQGSSLHRVDYLLKKADQKWIRQHRELLDKMELQAQ